LSVSEKIHLLLLPALSAGFCLMLTGQVTAQTFTNLYSFTGGSDGANPYTVIISGNILYGVADTGGTNGNGTIFALNTNGSGFTVLHTFMAGPGYYPNITNNDGVDPAGLILSGNRLYGTAVGGGTNGSGTIFAVNTNGMSFTNLHNFTGGSDGAYPNAVILSGNTLYGTTTRWRQFTRWHGVRGQH
jgi:uncharacterized repeat protein (TIGR03803 family)